MNYKIIRKSILFNLTSFLALSIVQATSGFADDSQSKGLPTQELRTALPGIVLANYSLHVQATSVSQGHGNSAQPDYSVGHFTQTPTTLSGAPETQTSFTTTLFVGASLWRGGSVYINPEVSAGSGLSKTTGVAGFPNGEIYRVDSPTPKFNLSRLYGKHVWGLGGEQETIESDQNQIAENLDLKRITLVAGKFSLNDFFDNNAYSHDPRTQFLNWSLMDNGAWDYAADTRGYTTGFMLEYNQKNFAVRFASVLEPEQANQLAMDTNITKAHGDNLEFEYRYSLGVHPGIARLLGYVNHAHMGNYEDSISSAAGGSPDITSTRAYRFKYGTGLNLEQQISPNLGSFARIGWNDGHSETWAFTEIENTVSGGLSWKPWEARQDRFGTALILNGLSPQHRAYLQAGGQGFIVGDGGLSYAPEQILETFYSLRLFQKASATADFQYVNHPGFNQDHAPAAIFGARMHYEL